MTKNIIISNSLYWAAIGFMAIVFIATIILNSYLFILDNQLTQQVYLSRVNFQKATLIVDYRIGQKRVFEGDIPIGGLTLYDVLLMTAESGRLDVKFVKTNDGKIHLLKIDQFINGDTHWWELQIPKLNWAKQLNQWDVDLKQIYITGGTTAYLTYK